MLQARGAMTLRVSGEGYVIEAARPAGVNRPWASAGDDPGVLVPALNIQTSTPRDATPREADIQPGE